MSKRICVFTIIAVFILSIASGFAQGMEKGRRKYTERAHPTQDKIQAKVDGLTKELNLTTNQQTKIKEILTNNQAERKKILFEAKAKIKELHQKAHQQIKALLTEEQKAKLQEKQKTKKTTTEEDLVPAEE